MIADQQMKQEDLINLEYLSIGLKQIQQEDSVKMTVQCIKLLNKEVIDIAILSKNVHMGFDEDTRKMRGLVWRLLLGYLSPNKKNWLSLLEKNKENYSAIVNENVSKSQPQKKNDHPLSRSTDSSWNNYFQDQQLWIKIQKDVVRTRSKELGEHKEALNKIIFLWCKLNKLDYVQGMNEVAALIFYAFKTDNSNWLQGYSESDAFYCFSIVMSTMKHNFYQEGNHQLKEKVRWFSELLRKIDRKLHDHLQELKIDYTMFCMKWFLTYMAQDLPILDSLRIWDTLFCQESVKEKEELLNYIAVSILMYLREDLLLGQFGEVIMMLQNLDKQNLNMKEVLTKAYLLQREQKKG